ncbi:MAG: hypothetical protein WAK86_15595 [Pseudonocardiaceae bacterium]
MGVKTLAGSNPASSATEELFGLDDITPPLAGIAALALLAVIASAEVDDHYSRKWERPQPLTRGTNDAR